MMFMAFTTLIFAVVTAFYPEKENPRQRDLKFKEVIVLVINEKKELIFQFHQFYSNKKLMMFTIFVFFAAVPFQAVAAPIVPMFIQKVNESH